MIVFFNYETFFIYLFLSILYDYSAWQFKIETYISEIIEILVAWIYFSVMSVVEYVHSALKYNCWASYMTAYWLTIKLLRTQFGVSHPWHTSNINI